jgi:3-oxoadipate enol-lactonase
MPSLPPAIKLAYEVHGEGPLVMALHDLGQCGATMVHALEDLLDRCRVVAPDLRGHGESPTPNGPWSVDDFAADVARLVVSNGAPATLVGVGLGAAAALGLALGHPGLVSGLVLSGVGPRAEDPEGHDRWMRIARGLRERGGPEGWAVAAEAMAIRPDWRGALAQVQAPAIVLAGQADRAVPVKLQRELSVWLPGGRFETVPGVGHNLAAEASKRLVAATERLLVTERQPVAA